MTSGQMFASRLKEIAAIAAQLPKGAEVTVEWVDAPLDLLLAVALLRGGHLRSVRFVGGGEMQRAVWKYRSLAIRAQRSSIPNTGGVKLALVKL